MALKWPHSEAYIYFRNVIMFVIQLFGISFDINRVHEVFSQIGIEVDGVILVWLPVKVIGDLQCLVTTKRLKPISLRACPVRVNVAMYICVCLNTKHNQKLILTGFILTPVVNWEIIGIQNVNKQEQWT